MLVLENSSNALTVYGHRELIFCNWFEFNVLIGKVLLKVVFEIKK